MGTRGIVIEHPEIIDLTPEMEVSRAETIDPNKVNASGIPVIGDRRDGFPREIRCRNEVDDLWNEMVETRAKELEKQKK